MNVIKLSYFLLLGATNGNAATYDLITYVTETCEQQFSAELDPVPSDTVVTMKHGTTFLQIQVPRAVRETASGHIKKAETMKSVTARHKDANLKLVLTSFADHVFLTFKDPTLETSKQVIATVETKFKIGDWPSFLAGETIELTITDDGLKALAEYDAKYASEPRVTEALAHVFGFPMPNDQASTATSDLIQAGEERLIRGHLKGLVVSFKNRVLRLTETSEAFVDPNSGLKRPKPATPKED